MIERKKDFILGDQHQLTIEIKDEGRLLHFKKECMDRVSVLGKVGNEQWKEIAKNVFTPFADNEEFDSPVNLAYKVIFEHAQNHTSNIVFVHLPSSPY